MSSEIQTESSSPKGRKRKKRKKKWSKKQKRFLFYGIIFLAGLICGGILLSFIGPLLFAQKYTLPNSSVIGIDISHHQGDIFWDNLAFSYGPGRELTDQPNGRKRKVDFVIAKATEGATHQDDRYDSFKRSCSRKNIPFGAYHYFKPHVSPYAQVQNFIKHSRLSSGNIIPVIDVEEHGLKSRSQLQSDVLEWLLAVESHYGVKPIIYCNISYYNEYFTAKQFRPYPFWIAAYSRPRLTMDYVLWQQTDRGIVQGIKGRVDINVYHGTESSFRHKMLL